MDTSYRRCIGKIQTIFLFTLDLWVGSLEEAVGPHCIFNFVVLKPHGYFGWRGVEMLLGEKFDL